MEFKAEASVGDKVAGASTAGAGSVEQRCPICLEDFEDKAFIDVCFHCFCFQCIVQWSQVTSTCPMCKTSFSSLIHNVRANDDYTQYNVQPKTRASDQEISLGEARRFRYHTTRVPGQARASAPSSSGQQEDGRQRERQREREKERRERRMAASQQLTNPASDERRRVVYALSLRAQPPHAEERKERVRDISAVFFQRNPACTHRLVPWLTREFGVLLGPEHVQFMIQLVLSLVDKIDLESDEFPGHLQPFLHGRTPHFLHELVNFARSPFNMAAYDHRVHYEWPLERLRDSWDPEATVNAVTQQLQHSPIPGTSGLSMSDHIQERLFYELTNTRWDDSPPSLHVSSPILVHASDSETDTEESAHGQCGTSMSTGGAVSMRDEVVEGVEGGTAGGGNEGETGSGETGNEGGSGETGNEGGSRETGNEGGSGGGGEGERGEWGGGGGGGGGNREEGGNGGGQGRGGNGEGGGGGDRGKDGSEGSESSNDDGGQGSGRDEDREQDSVESDAELNQQEASKKSEGSTSTGKDHVTSSSAAQVSSAAAIVHAPLQDEDTITSTTRSVASGSRTLEHSEARAVGGDEDEEDSCIVINADSENEHLGMEPASVIPSSVGTSAAKKQKSKGKRPAGESGTRYKGMVKPRREEEGKSDAKEKHKEKKLKSTRRERGSERSREHSKEKERRRRREKSSHSHERHRSTREHCESRRRSRSGSSKQHRGYSHRRRSRHGELYSRDRRHSSSESESDTENYHSTERSWGRRRKRRFGDSDRERHMFGSQSSSREFGSRKEDDGSPEPYCKREKLHRSRLYSDDIVNSQTACENVPSGGERKRTADAEVDRPTSSRSASLKKQLRVTVHDGISKRRGDSREAEQKLKHSRRDLEGTTKLREELSCVDREITEHKRELLQAMLRCERLKLLHRQLRGEDLPTNCSDDLHNLGQPLVINETTPTSEVVQQLAELDQAITDGKRKVLHVMKKIEEQAGFEGGST